MKKKDRLKGIAKQRFQSSVEGGGERMGYSNTYSKYGDYNPSDIHEGTATYRGSTLPDSSITNRNMFARYVRRGGGGSNRKGFILDGKLYKFTGSASSDAHSSVEI